MTRVAGRLSVETAGCSKTGAGTDAGTATGSGDMCDSGTGSDPSVSVPIISISEPNLG